MGATARAHVGRNAIFVTDHPLDETELIQTYLAPLTRGAAGAFDLSDDAAVLSPPAGSDLVISTDPIIAGVHFFADDRADDIAWKALAVNVSDLVAKGATPWAYTMTLAFPAVPDRQWMATFSSGLEAAQHAFGCALVGGDTDRTPGPLAIGVTAIGLVKTGDMIRRRTARAGDHVVVTGTLGDSALGLTLHRAPAAFGSEMMAGDAAFLIGRYLRPNPRLELVPALRCYATAALDISDGFLKDCERLVGSGGLTVPFSRLPLSPSARSAVAAEPGLRSAILAGGDDYEVLFSVAPEDVGHVVKAAANVGVNVTDLGVITGTSGISVVDSDGQEIRNAVSGYDHFRQK